MMDCGYHGKLGFLSLSSSISVRHIYRSDVFLLPLYPSRGYLVVITDVLTTPHTYFTGQWTADASVTVWSEMTPFSATSAMKFVVLFVVGVDDQRLRARSSKRDGSVFCRIVWCGGCWWWWWRRWEWGKKTIRHLEQNRWRWCWTRSF